MDNKSEIASLPNLGPKAEQWLNDIGIFTKQDLEKLGSAKVVFLLEEHGYKPSLNFLWAVEGTLVGLPWEKIPPELKQELKEELSALRNENV